MITFTWFYERNW